MGGGGGVSEVKRVRINKEAVFMIKNLIVFNVKISKILVRLLIEQINRRMNGLKIRYQYL